MKTHQFANSVYESFAHANVLLTMIREKDIEFRLIPNGISVHVLNEGAASYLEEVCSTTEGQSGIQLVKELISKGEPIDDIVLIKPYVMHTTSDMITCEVVRRVLSNKPTLH